MKTNKSQLEKFIEKSKNKHGEFYDYTQVNFIDNNTEVTIICPIHGEFQQKPLNHRNGYGCKSCGQIRTLNGLKHSNDQRRKTLTEFIKKANEIHNHRYDYSLVDYVNTNYQVQIICPIHGSFLQKPCKHINKQHPTGCPYCANKYLTTEDFIKKAKRTHGDKYVYTKTVFVNDNTKLVIICPTHGEFTQLPSHHHSLGQGCPKCKHDHHKNNIGGYNQQLFESNPDYKTLSATLYYVRLSDDSEVFYKIGITKQNDYKNRFYSIPYQVDTIRIIEGNLYDIWRLEQQLLSTITDQYIPLKKFHGYTECFMEPINF